MLFSERSNNRLLQSKEVKPGLKASLKVAFERFGKNLQGGRNRLLCNENEFQRQQYRTSQHSLASATQIEVRAAPSSVDGLAREGEQNSNAREKEDKIFSRRFVSLAKWGGSVGSLGLI